MQHPVSKVSAPFSPRITGLIATLMVLTGVAALIAMALMGSPGNLVLIHYHTIKSFIAGRHELALSLFFIFYVITVALCLPTNVILALTAGALFGGMIGGVLSIAAATLGGTFGVIALRAGFAKPVARRASKRLERVLHALRRNAFVVMLFLRLIPIVPFFMVNVAAGVSAIRLPVFALATAVGIAPIVFLYTFTTARLEHVIAKHAEVYAACRVAENLTCPTFSLQDALSWQDLIPLFVLAVITILPMLVQHWLAWRARRERAHV